MVRVLTGEPARNALPRSNGASAHRADLIRGCARQERLPAGVGAFGTKTELRAAEAFPPFADARGVPLREASYVPRKDFAAALSRRFEDDLATLSRDGLRRIDPMASADRFMTAPQFAVAMLAVAALAAGLALDARATLITVNAALTGYFLLAIGFRALLVGVALSETSLAASSPRLVAELPVITILLPAFAEAEGLASLKRAIDALDYPPEKLDIKLILESDDQETRDEAMRLRLDEAWDVVVVPPSHPRTKPKALNHALYLARGEIVVVYDAEDAPETDQLQKAVALFAASEDDLVCVQARLNYYNAADNWLTRGIMAQTPRELFAARA